MGDICPDCEQHGTVPFYRLLAQATDTSQESRHVIRVRVQQGTRQRAPSDQLLNSCYRDGRACFAGPAPSRP